MLNALSIDLEDWFHLLDIKTGPPLNEWRALESRVERNTDTLLRVLDRQKVHATFFVLGWIAEIYPELVQRIAREGHEIASHGYAHRLVYDSTPEEFEQDIERSRKAIHAAVGTFPRGYRAPGFSLNKRCLWAFDTLARSGFLYDSSIFPSFRDHGGFYGHPTEIVCHSCAGGGSVWEFPISMYSVAGIRIGFSGGGYFRLWPLAVIQSGIQKLNAQGRPAVVYLHPRDIDQGQPRLRMPLRRRFQCYVHLVGTAEKLERLLERLRFAPIIEALGGYLRANGQALGLAPARQGGTVDSTWKLAHFPWERVP